jgi:putative membrane protein
MRSNRARRAAWAAATFGAVAMATGCVSHRVSGGDVATPSAVADLTTRLAASVRSDANIAALLHESNAAEIQAGAMARQRALNPDIRAFGAQMVTEHAMLDSAGTSLADRLGITPELPDSTLPTQHQDEMIGLDMQSGGAFDSFYITQQVLAHQRTLVLVDRAIATTQNAELRAMLQSQVRPHVVQHLARAEELQRSVPTP